MVGNMGHMGGLINLRPWHGQYRAGFSNTGGSPKPRKKAPCPLKNNGGNEKKFAFWVKNLRACRFEKDAVDLKEDLVDFKMCVPS